MSKQCKCIAFQVNVCQCSTSSQALRQYLHTVLQLSQRTVEFNVPLDTLEIISGTVFTANLLDVW